MFKQTAAIIAIATALFLPAQAQAELTAADVEKIVEKYIMEHPEVIMKSVDDFQVKSMQQRSAAALKDYKLDLLRDDRVPRIGPDDADITLIEFFDYNCGYCKKAFEDVKGLIDSDKKLRVMFRELPILGPTSETASKWALAAAKQNKYFEYHQKLMQHKGPINDETLASLAKEAGLDVEKLKKDAEGTDIMVQIEKNRHLATQIGINGTPGFILGDEIMPGAVPKEVMQEKIKALRAAPKTEEKPAAPAPAKAEEKKTP